MVSSLQAGTTKRQKAGLSAIGLQSHTWSVGALREACQEQGIECEESKAFSALRGVVVRCGKTIIMSIRASLEEREKIFTIAHELAHLALNYLPSDPVVYLKDNEPTPRLIQNSRKEQEVDVWAAHFLVIPEVFEYCLEEAQALFPPEQALEEARTRTAHCLNIPVRVVGLWLRSRDIHFAVAPRVWLARGCAQRVEEESKISQASPSQDLDSRKDAVQQVVLRLARSLGVSGGKAREAVRKGIRTDQLLQRVWITYEDTHGRSVGRAKISIDWECNRVLAQFGEQEPCKIDLTRPLRRQISESSSRQSAQLDAIRAGCVLKRPEILYEYQG